MINNKCSKYKFLIVGLGSIGKRHLQNLLDLSAGVVEICHERSTKKNDIEKKYGIESHFDLHTALTKKPDVVLITNPTSMHMKVAFEAAKEGCNLFIEKPLSDNLIGLHDLVNIVNKKKLKVLIGCNLRFNPGLKVVKELIDSKVIGNLLSAHIEVGEYLPDWHPWEDYRKSYSANGILGGGVILTLIHELDYAYWFFNIPNKVFCFCSNKSKLNIDVEDCAKILLNYNNGLLVDIHMDYLQRPPSRKCKIVGEKGKIEWDYYKNEVIHYNVKTKRWNIISLSKDFNRNDMYIAEMKHLLQYLDGKEDPVVSLEDGIKVLEIALSAKQSAKYEKVIKLKE